MGLEGREGAQPIVIVDLFFLGSLFLVVKLRYIEDVVMLLNSVQRRSRDMKY